MQQCLAAGAGDPAWDPLLPSTVPKGDQLVPPEGRGSHVEVAAVLVLSPGMLHGTVGMLGMPLSSAGPKSCG